MVVRGVKTVHVSGADTGISPMVVVATCSFVDG